MTTQQWQMTFVYGGLLLLLVAILLRWHRSPLHKNFCLLHLIANREGYLDQDKIYLAASFLIAAFATMNAVIKNEVDPQVVLLVGGLVSAFALKSGWSYTVARRGDVDVKTAEIRRGRHDDEDAYLGSDRRERTADLEDERPPGMAKRSVLR